MDFLVSVVIPAYNCERYIEKAITSVIQQPEVAEIVVVNDGSTDTTQSILEALQKQNQIIKVYHHENNSNKGRSASRNLAIKNATANYIAFLDADDYYLPNRFVSDKKIFLIDDKVDGVYNAIGANFYRDASDEEQEQLELTTIRENVKPEELFEVLLSGEKGHFSIDGLTLKRTVFESVGYFDETLKVSEDTNLFFKLALKCQLNTGIVDKPVAMRGVHNNNVFNRNDLYKKYQIKMFESLFFWCGKNEIPVARIDTLLNTIWLIKYKTEDSLIGNLKYWAFLFSNNPRVLFNLMSIKYFPVIRLRKKLFPFLYRT